MPSKSTQQQNLTAVKSEQSRSQLEEKLLKEKEADRQSCGQEIDALFVKYKCGWVTLVQVGDKAVPLNQVLALPFQTVILSQ